MKKFYLLLCLLFPAVISNGQQSFDPEAFRQYRESIRDINYQDLAAKHENDKVFYSRRDKPSNLSEMAFMDSIILKLELTGYEQDLISNNHFMVSERLSSRSFVEAYDKVYELDLPLFISTDLFLHALHSSYDKILKTLEINFLEPNLLDLLEGLRQALENYYDQNQPVNEIMQAVMDVDLYLSVAQSLLQNSSVEPLYDNSGNYETLMGRLQEPEGILEIALFADHKRKMDLSQFIPRGHYTDILYTPTGEKDLSYYFKSMMWLGRIDFMLTTPPVGQYEPEWSKEDLKRMAMAALLINDLLERSGKKTNLEYHEKLISFLVGPDDNLTPRELTGIADAMQIGIGSLLDDETYDNFVQKLNESDDYGQKIMSNFFCVDGEEDPVNLPVSYRLLGQKFILDSYIFSKVVYDRIVYQERKVKRMLPDPLDMLFVLGNDNALELLRKEIEEYHYGANLEELRYLTDNYDEGFWRQSLYNNWLASIRSLNKIPDGTTLPYFMQTTQWQTQKMNTQLASWTELRHDNVLYAKQSYTGGASCSFPHVYVEPYPEFYQSMATFAEKARLFFAEMNGSEFAGIAGYYQQFEVIMKKMASLSARELKGEAFTNEEIRFLKQFYSRSMMCGTIVDGWYKDLFFDNLIAEESDFLVVDVHTQPTDPMGNIVGKVLHTGTGNIDMGVFIAAAPSNENQPTAFVGPVMSFHERIEMNFKRLTDEEWEELFPPESAGYDGRPDWVNGYLAGYNGQARGEGRSIAGEVYSQTGIPAVQPDKIAYFFVWPNPVEMDANLHFVLNEKARVNLQLFDITGRQTGIFVEDEMTAGDHYYRFSGTGLSSGIYFAVLTADNQRKVIKIMIDPGK